jgi:cytochrome c nitrite reductase small subunit
MALRHRWKTWSLAGIVLSGLCGAFLGTGTFTFVTAQGHSYFSNNPAACLNCHIMREQFDGWVKSSHHTAAVCNDCHLSPGPLSRWISKADNGFRHSWAFTFQDFHEPIQMHPRGAAALQENCLRCHQSFVAEIAGHPPAGGETVDCVRCHSDVGHALHP